MVHEITLCLAYRARSVATGRVSFAAAHAVIDALLGGHYMDPLPAGSPARVGFWEILLPPVAREQATLYAALHAAGPEDSDAAEAMLVLLATHAVSVCESLLDDVRNALRDSIREDEDLYAADAQLCRFLRSHGICQRM